MKKSIYKITAWSLCLSVALVFVIGKSQLSNTPKQSIVSSVSDNNNESASADNSYATNTENYTNDLPASTIQTNSTTNSTGTNSNNQSIAVAPDMGITTMEADANNTNSFDQNNQDALAKGGPNNEYQTQSYNNTTTSNNTGSLPTISVGGSSTGSTPRVSAPTVVTAPSSPGVTGGGSSGDPFVPIDDYYGLIFLIAVSTFVGVFTIKKSKLI